MLYTYTCGCLETRTVLNRSLADRDAEERHVDCGHLFKRVEVETQAAPLLYSLSSAGTRACDKTASDFK